MLILSHKGDHHETGSFCRSRCDGITPGMVLRFKRHRNFLLSDRVEKLNQGERK
jgi:hypothetical protein